MQVFHLDMKLSQYRGDYLEKLFPRLRQAGYGMILFEIETEAMSDRWRAAMLDIYQPAGVERAHAVVFGESKRLLPLVSWGLFE